MDNTKHSHNLCECFVCKIELTLRLQYLSNSTSSVHLVSILFRFTHKILVKVFKSHHKLRLSPGWELNITCSVQVVDIFPKYQATSSPPTRKVSHTLLQSSARCFESWVGVEPTYGGFANRSVNHFATRTLLNVRTTLAFLLFKTKYFTQTYSVYFWLVLLSREL